MFNHYCRDLFWCTLRDKAGDLQLLAYDTMQLFTRGDKYKVNHVHMTISTCASFHINVQCFWQSIKSRIYLV